MARLASRDFDQATLLDSQEELTETHRAFWLEWWLGPLGKML